MTNSERISAAFERARNEARTDREYGLVIGLELMLARVASQHARLTGTGLAEEVERVVANHINRHSKAS